MKTMLSFFVVMAMMAIIVLTLMHGMVSEVEIRELKRDRMAYNMILADRALAEHAVARDLSSIVHRPTSHVPRVSP